MSQAGARSFSRSTLNLSLTCHGGAKIYQQADGVHLAVALAPRIHLALGQGRCKSRIVSMDCLLRDDVRGD